MGKNEIKTDMPYEQAIAELESIVNLLESGELTLEDSMKMFEKGVGLVRYCNKKLDDIEKRITIILEENNQIDERDFTPEG
ncbi:MAG: exodeoxyribonuclease VII small subunit [Clostridiaceae bacterium]|nr:exodeoxyribonuclease VII small subunit [Clostridiaceae bacterium]